MRISARNQLRGKLVNLRIDGLMAEVEVDVGGQTVVAMITAGSAQRLALKVGDDVVAIVKASEVMIGK
jgi:molybdopterin-binding protein